MSLVTRIRKSEELTVPFTPEEVWGVLADVADYPRWWPATRGLRILNSPPGPLGTEFEVRPLLGRAFCCRLEELERPSNLRIRFFGGALEGPGGFHLKPADNSTRVRYDIDLFARGLGVAVLSRMVPLERIHGLRMRRVLRSLGRRLIKKRKEIARVTPLGAPVEAVAQRAAASHRIRSLISSLAAWLREGSEGKAGPGPVRETAGVSGPEPGSDFGIARGYLHALSTDTAACDLARFFQPEALEEEFPNPMLPKGATRDLAALLNGRSLSREKWSGQTFDLRGATSGGSQVAMEVHWAGTSTGDTHVHAAGQRAGARLAIFLKFHDHRIVRQRTYISLVSAVPEPEDPLGKDLLRQTEAGSQVSAIHRPRPAASNFDIARLYLDALSSGKSAEEIAPFFAGDAIQEEFPSRFEPMGARRGREAIAQARERVRAFLDSEDYQLLAAHGGGSKVAMEVHWTGVVAANRPPFVAGQKLELRSAIFLKFRDGLIVRQRNYDCISPLGFGPLDLTS